MAWYGIIFLVTVHVHLFLAVSGATFNVVDFAEESERGFMYTSSDDIELTYDGAIPADSGRAQNDQVVGIRFKLNGIERAASIDSAKVTFEAKRNGTGITPILRIKADFARDAGPTSNILSMRTETTASQRYEPGTWTENQLYSVNIKNIVEEIVNRGDWEGGNHLVLIIKRDNEDSSTRTRRAKGNPVLEVSFTNPAETPPPVPVDSPEENPDADPQSEENEMVIYGVIGGASLIGVGFIGCYIRAGRKISNAKDGVEVEWNADPEKVQDAVHAYGSRPGAQSFVMGQPEEEGTFMRGFRRVQASFRQYWGD